MASLAVDRNERDVCVRVLVLGRVPCCKTLHREQCLLVPLHAPGSGRLAHSPDDLAWPSKPNASLIAT